MIGRWFIKFFFALYLILLFLELEYFAFYFKPFLVPSLLFLFIGNSSFFSNTKLLFALFFSTLGDIFLMGEGSLFFLLGLSSFLIAHLVYIALFYYLYKPIKINVGAIISLLVLIIFESLLLSFLWPYLGSLSIPVFAYATVLLLMFWFSLFAVVGNGELTSGFIVIGALCFVCSDSLLSIRLFVREFEKAHFLVMSSYLVAQYLIVSGVLDQSKKTKSSPIK